MVSALAFSPDGRMLARGSRDGGVIRLWEVVTAQVRRPFAGHRGAVLSLAFSPDGKTLLSGGEDTTARSWDLAAPGREG